MTKYKKLFLFTFLSLTLTQILGCSNPKKNLSIAICSSNLRNKDCSLVQTYVSNKLRYKKNLFFIRNSYNEKSDYSNFLKLYNKKVDFSFVSNSIFDDYRGIQKKLKNIRGVIPVFYVPLFIITSDPTIKTLKDLNNKNIGIEPLYSNTYKIAYNILHKARLNYNAVYEDSSNLPFLLEDKTIDAFFCFSMSCFNEINISAKSNDNTHMINIPKNIAEQIIQESLYYQYSVIKLPSKLKIKNHSVKTIGSWLNILTLKSTDDESVTQITSSVLESLEEEKFDYSNLIDIAFSHKKKFNNDLIRTFFYKPLHKAAFKFYQKKVTVDL